MSDVKQLRQNLAEVKETRLQNVVALGELVHKSRINNVNNDTAIQQLSTAILHGDQQIYQTTKQILAATATTGSCSKCQSELPASAKFCGTCGQVNEVYVLNNAPTKQCGTCNQQIDATSQFCPCCGVVQGGN